MRQTRFLFLLFVMIWTFTDLIAQQSGTTEAKAGQKLQHFFQALRHKNPETSLPSHEDLLKVNNPIGGMTGVELSLALPEIFRALEHPDDRVKIYATSTVFAVSLRPDSSAVLADYLERILGLLEANDSRLQGSPAMILLNMPATASQAIPRLVTFVRRTDRDPQAQVAAIFTVARFAPRDADALEAIDGFLQRPLEVRTKIDALNAIGVAQVANPALRRRVRGFLRDAHAGVRFTAAGVIGRMGRAAVGEAQSELRQMEANDEDAAVRKAARESLHVLEKNKR